MWRQPLQLRSVQASRRLPAWLVALQSSYARPFGFAQCKLAEGGCPHIQAKGRCSLHSCNTFLMSRPEPGPVRDLIELIFGYGLIVFILWMPEFPQRILSPVALIVTLAIVLARRPSLDDLGLSRRGLISSLWNLPAT